MICNIIKVVLQHVLDSRPISLYLSDFQDSDAICKNLRQRFHINLPKTFAQTSIISNCTPKEIDFFKITEKKFTITKHISTAYFWIKFKLAYLINRSKTKSLFAGKIPRLDEEENIIDHSLKSAHK